MEDVMTTLPMQHDADSAACCDTGCCGGEKATIAAPPHGEPLAGEQLAATVRERYGAAARRVMDGVAQAQAASASCCGPVSSCCGSAAFDGTVDPITSNLYVTGETDQLPEA